MSSFADNLGAKNAPFANNSPTTVGSRSTNTARGTCFPAPVSLKKVLNESSPPPMVLSDGICPSGWIPCSRQYSSQQALPICTPAWPTWIEMHSRCENKFRNSQASRKNESKQQTCHFLFLEKNGRKSFESLRKLAPKRATGLLQGKNDRAHRARRFFRRFPHTPR